MLVPHKENKSVPNGGYILLALDHNCFAISLKIKKNRFKALSLYAEFLSEILDYVNSSDIYVLEQIIYCTVAIYDTSDTYVKEKLFFALGLIFEKLIDNKETLLILEKYFDVKYK